MRVNRAYLEAVLVASLLLMGGGYIASTSAEQQDELVDLSYLEGDWDFNGIEAFVRPATLVSAASEDNRGSAPAIKARMDRLLFPTTQK
jgi:hypothetical protein